MPQNSRWREASRKVIQQVAEENPELRGEDLRKVLRTKYPFQQRSGWAYQVWLQECRAACQMSYGKPAATNQDIRHFWVDEE